jgi:AcrR family transcriptional regulator
VKIEQYVQHSCGGAPGAAIAAVARARFQRFGYPKTSMQEIAEDCGMSVANLYRYYEGKLAIGAAVATAEQAAIFAVCDRAVAAVRGDLTVKLITLFHTLIDGTRRQIKSTPLLFELGMTVAREQPERRQRYLQETENRIAAILAAGGNDEALAAGDAKGASRLILMASAPFVLPWMLRTLPFGNPRPQVEPLMKCLVSGLTKANSQGAAASVDHSDPLWHPFLPIPAKSRLSHTLSP